MDKNTRNLIQKATQDARQLLKTEFAEQLEGLFDILPDGYIATLPGEHLKPNEHVIREKIVTAIEHEKASGISDAEAVSNYLREVSFTYLNRLSALKMIEARGLVQECVSKGEHSSGFKEFLGLAPGLAELPDNGYRLYLESLFDELSMEISVLFDRRDLASLLWPRQKAFERILEILNRTDIAKVWGEDETIGWIYQYFNSSEERKKMRDESAAPRNSQELAVRNQFFTPRYVVEFLTDNTLGRIWYEMRKGDTALKEKCSYLVSRPKEVFLASGEKAPAESENETDISQEELLKKTAHIEHRHKKDPRDLRVIDPACGSGHFLLYAFDLLEHIYEEAWKDLESPQSEATGRTLREDFETLDDLHRIVPKLIIEQNLHGIDIDPRAVQIAAVALWLRAQKTWKNLGVNTTERLRIVKSNIVTAEPMPGEKDMLREFTAGLNPPVLGQLVEVVFDKMKLAGEAGSLLKIEEGIKDVVGDARKQWVEGPKPEQQLFFPGLADPQPQQQKLHFDFKGVTDGLFWEQAEERILDALKNYAERAENGHGILRRLFAHDAAQGFAFIDHCRKRYDVVLMNPPFGSPTVSWRDDLSSIYPVCRSDIYAAFVQRACELLCAQGTVGAITNRTAFFTGGFAEWRNQFFKGNGLYISLFGDLGSNVLDSALVEVASYVITKDRQTSSPCVSIGLLGEAKKGSSLLAACSSVRTENAMSCVYLIEPKALSLLPNQPFAYWVSKSLLRLFSTTKKMEPAELNARLGLRTLNDFRFLRLWVEVPYGFQKNRRWVFHLKGGPYHRYYAPPHLVCLWRNEGRELKTLASSKYGSESRTIQAQEYYFRRGLTYSRRTTSRLSVRIAPAECNFADRGPLVVAVHDTPEQIYYLLGLLNTDVIEYMIALGLAAGENAARSYEVGLIQRLPVISLSTNERQIMAANSEQIVKLLWEMDLFNFLSPYCRFYSDPTKSIADITRELNDKWGNAISRIEKLRKSNEKIIRSFIKIDENDPHIAGFFSGNKDKLRNKKCDKNALCDSLGLPRSWSKLQIASGVLEMSVGALFGRYDIRTFFKDSKTIEKMDFLDRIPDNSETMLTSDQLSAILAKQLDYPIRISDGGVLVDDPGFNGDQPHRNDIVHRVRKMIHSLWKDKAVNIEQELCDILCISDLRPYFRKNFFPSHIKNYSQSRRKAPIYWQLSTPSASYSIWLYYHRFTKDTLYKVLNEYVMPKLKFEERELTNIRQQYGASPTARQRKEITEREALVAELTAFKEEVARIAPLWNPNLNDGVIINYAPLWRLVPQNKPWQKECKKIWEKLVNCDCDWAHLAMHLWPERVVKKCTKDRSLAIAHRLEEIFWEENNKGKWESKKVTKKVLNGLIQEHTSPTVKAAMEDFLKTPLPANMAVRKRKKKI